MFYVVETSNELLLRTTSKFEACSFWSEIQGSTLDATLWFQGEIIDTNYFLDYSLDVEPNVLDWDLCGDDNWLDLLC